jgi:hypothetical protein
MSKSHSNGANTISYMMDQIRGALQQFTLTPEDVNRLKMDILGTTDSHAGSNGIMYCDNSGALNVAML